MITIETKPTRRTGKCSLGERHKLSMSASKTILRSVGGIHGHELSTSTFSLVRNVVYELPPRCISNAFGQMVIMNHVFNGEVFNTNHAILVNYSPTPLVGKIPSPIKDTFVDTRNNRSFFSPLLRAFDFFGHFTLRLSQNGFVYTKEFRIRNSTTVRKSGERRQSNINAYRLQTSWQKHFRDFTRETGKPFSSTSSLNTAGLNLPLNGTMYNSFDGANFRQYYTIGIDRESKLRIGETIIPTTAFEARISSLLTRFYTAEESLKCLVHSMQYILRNLRVDCRIFRTIRFYIWYLGTLITKRDRNTVFLPSISSFFNRAIIEMTTKLQCFIKNTNLALCRVNPILKISSYHAFPSLLFEPWKDCPLAALSRIHALVARLSKHGIGHEFVSWFVSQVSSVPSRVLISCYILTLRSPSCQDKRLKLFIHFTKPNLSPLDTIGYTIPKRRCGYGSR